MDKLLKDFFQNFLSKNRLKMAWFSFWRMFAFVQVLFWPFAFSKIIDILSQGVNNWQRALPWLAALIINNIVEDFVRLRSKYGLQRLGAQLELSLATFFTEKTELYDGIKTGEAVQRTKKATSTISEAASYYKDNLLRLPVNLIVVPVVLLKTRLSYFVILITYIIIYLLLDYFANTFYLNEAEDYFRASEAFWGTTYRKAPDVWRKREDGVQFEDQMNREAEGLYKERMEMENVNNWRWVMVQALSSLSLGIIIFYTFDLVVRGQAPVGDLVLVSGYFAEAQSGLNIISSTVRRIVDLRISLNRLAKAVRLKTEGS